MSRTLKATCAYCGDEFLAERNTAKFCRPAHRTAYNGLKTRIENQYLVACRAIDEIARIRTYHKHTSATCTDAFDAIEKYAGSQYMTIWIERKSEPDSK